MQGELFSEVVDNGGLAEARARTFFRQVLLGMAYCHRRKLVHRDIKLENLLLTGDRARPSSNHSSRRWRFGTTVWSAQRV